MAQCVELISVSQDGPGGVTETVGGVAVPLTSVVGLRSGGEPSPCTGYVLLTPVEYSMWIDSPLNLSAEDGLALSVAILSAWGAAFAVRALIRTLNVNDGADDN